MTEFHIVLCRSVFLEGRGPRGTGTYYWPGDNEFTLDGSWRLFLLDSTIDMQYLPRESHE